MSDEQTSQNTRDPGHPPGARRYGDLDATEFGDVGEVPKDDARLEAFAAAEEANSAIGNALAVAGYEVEVARTLTSVQNDLFDLASDLGTPWGSPPDAVRIEADHVAWVERARDHFGAELPDVDGFVLPGGTLYAALLYQARVAVRRAERTVVRAAREHPDQINPLIAKYLNAVSSLLFVLARAHNTEHGDMMWRPLASITPPDGSRPQDG
ncbi:MAG TPA: cob(I)yrinic acid a,c-diamide adenosyltransferase [Nocardioidaceae bacterium]|nr:cob(I)yrinic acid a,c-diamide adenosyltransferase [Nocardioidaceae bacterium]